MAILHDGMAMRQHRINYTIRFTIRHQAVPCQAVGESALTVMITVLATSGLRLLFVLPSPAQVSSLLALLLLL